MNACAIGLGGGVVRLRPRATIDPLIGSWAPDFPPPEEPVFDITVDAIVSTSTDRTPAFDPIFTHRRFDLVFALHPSRRRAEAVFDGHPDGLLAVLELAVAGALPRCGGLLVHAAGVVIDGGLWLLPGPSGTGKSTAARASDIDRVLSDERVIVRPTADGWRGWGTPWWSAGRTRPYDGGAAPVVGLGRIHHAPAAASRRMAADEAAAWLLGSVSLYEQSAINRRAAFEAACDLIERVRCLHLDVPLEGVWSRSITTE